jgi:hypothetical protein
MAAKKYSCESVWTPSPLSFYAIRGLAVPPDCSVNRGLNSLIIVQGMHVPNLCCGRLLFRAGS